MNLKNKKSKNLSDEDATNDNIEENNIEESQSFNEENIENINQDTLNSYKNENNSVNNENSKNIELDDFLEEKKIKTGNSSLELLKDVPLKVVVELGRTVLKIGELMELGVGSIIELNKLYGDPVDIYVNNKLIGKGEVVVIDEDFAVRITEILTNPEANK